MTSFGRGLLLLVLATGGAGCWTGWAELQVVAVSGAVVLAGGLVLVLVPEPADATLTVQPDRVTVGDPVTVDVDLWPRLLPMLNPQIVVQLGEERRTLRLPVLLPLAWRRRRAEPAPVAGRLDLLAGRRGVHQIGPVTRVRADPCGSFRRQRHWPVVAELFVRPRIAMLEQQETGRISDLDGVVSDRPAASDLAFHTLREYVPGDDRRHVHWRSSAKADRLLVRQFVETRRSQTLVVVDDDPAAYASDLDFELAVSVAASVAVRATLDNCEVTLACGGLRVRSESADLLLDETCRFETRGHDLIEVILGAELESGGANLAVVVTGSRRTDAELLVAAAQLPAQAMRILVKADPSEASLLNESYGTRLVSVARLEELPELFTGAHR